MKVIYDPEFIQMLKFKSTCAVIIHIYNTSLSPRIYKSSCIANFSEKETTTTTKKMKQ